MGDTSRHLISFNVENFKRFESFEMKDLGQFNLIVGDNNVGKTSVLEALLFDGPSWLIYSKLFLALEYRRITKELTYGDLDYYVSKKKALNEAKYSVITRFQLLGGTEVTIELEFDKRSQSIGIKNSPKDILNYPTDRKLMAYKADMNYNFGLPFIPFYMGHDEDLSVFFSRLQESRSQKERFIKSLSVVLPSLTDIAVSIKEGNSQLLIYQSDVDYSLPLALFGDGTLKLFRILAEIILNKGSRLMIDEVDAGIHFSRFKEFWKIILKTAKENDVQLFMTTHNQECIQYFKEVLGDVLPEFQGDARVISLVENTESKSIRSFTYRYHDFEMNLNVGNEIRG